MSTDPVPECPECGEPVDAEGITLTTDCCEHCCDGTCPEYHDSPRTLRPHPAIPVPPTVPERTAQRFTGPTITPEEN